MNTLVKINNLTKSFGKFQALNGVSFEMKKGEVLGFIGPNGAGKSTTIRVLLGMLKADSGEVSIFNQDVWKEAVEIHKRVVYVPGDVNLWPNLTGGEVIDLFLSLRGQEVNKKYKEELIKRFEFDPTKKCRAYSKGNRQKVALIAAFAAPADLYILDEPTSGLDPLQERVFQECVEAVKGEGASVLLSSHILSEVERLCDSVAIIRHGKIVETGSLEKLQHLTRIQVMVKTQKQITGLEEQPWAHDIVFEGKNVFFQLDSNHMGDLISFVQPFGVVKFDSSPAKLEDLFMRHYESAKGGL